LQEPIDEATVLVELKRAIARALRIPEETIHPETVLTRDLEAESLDFIDINYNLEQTFGFRMARHFILEHAEELLGEGSVIDEDARLTELAVVLLKERFGDQASSLRAGMDMEEVLTLVSVRSMVNAAMDVLSTLPEKCPRCGRSAWKTEDGRRVACGSCGEEAAYTEGDELARQWLARFAERHRLEVLTP